MPDPEIVRHVLIGRFRPDVNEEQVQAFFADFRSLCGRIDGIVSFEYGKNNSTEGLDRGLTHVTVLTFSNVQARDAYLPHPEHRKFVERWFSQQNIIEELMVVDYIPKA